MLRSSILALAFALPALNAEEPATAKVTGAFAIPKEEASFEGRVVELRLYKYDPRIADKAADLVEKVEFKDFAHTTGKETKKEFTLGAKAELDAKMSYYVTCFVLDAKGIRTHRGKCDHDPRGIGSVLTGGKPNEINIAIAVLKK